MRELYNKIAKYQQLRKDCWTNESSKLLAFIKCIPLWIAESYYTLRSTSHYWRHSSYLGFQNLAKRENDGTYLNSYSTYLNVHKRVAAYATTTLAVMGMAVAMFVFTFTPQSEAGTIVVDLDIPEGYHVVSPNTIRKFNDDGTITDQFYSAPRFYQTINGDWRPVDELLQVNDEGEGVLLFNINNKPFRLIPAYDIDGTTVLRSEADQSIRDADNFHVSIENFGGGYKWSHIFSKQPNIEAVEFYFAANDHIIEQLSDTSIGIDELLVLDFADLIDNGYTINVTTDRVRITNLKEGLNVLDPTDEPYNSTAAADGQVSSLGVAQSGNATSTVSVSEIFSEYTYVRSFFSFDTSAIDDGASITNGTLQFRISSLVSGRGNDSNFSTNFRSGHNGIGAALDGSDYSCCGATNHGNTIYTTTGTKNVTLVSPATAVNVTGDTDFRLAPSWSVVDGTTKTLTLYQTENGSNIPTLLVTYTVASLDLSGVVYTDEGSAPLDGSGVNKTVNVSVNGVLADTDEITAIDGAWAVTGLTVGSGQKIAVYLDDEAEEATTVFVTDGINKTDVDLYQNAVIVREDFDGTITNADLSGADDGDDDIKYNVDGFNQLTVDSGFEIHVWTGDTFDPNENVTTSTTGGDLHIDDNATVIHDSSSDELDIGVDVYVDTGATLNLSEYMEVRGGDIVTAGTGQILDNGVYSVQVRGSGTIGGGTGAIEFHILTLGYIVTGSTTFASDISFNTALQIPVGHVVSVNSGKVVDMTTTGGFNANLKGTIQGDARMDIKNGALPFPTTGTVNIDVRFDPTFEDLFIQARTFGGDVEIYNDSASRVGNVNLSSGTHTFNGNVTLNANNTQNIIFSGSSNNPTVDIAGDVDFTGTGGGTETWNTGSGTWTVTGNVDITGGTYTDTDGTLDMDGVAKTFTSGGVTVGNLTLSGSIIIANQTHNIAGSLDLSGTVTDGTSTVVMSGDGTTIVGNGQTLNNLTVDGTNNTVTLATSYLIVDGTLDIDTGDTLAVDTGLSLVHYGQFTLDGTIDGPGRYTHRNPFNFPSTGTVNSIVRFHVTDGSRNTPARTFGNDVEVYGNSSGVRSLVVNTAGTMNIDGDLYVTNDGTASVYFANESNSADINVTGDVYFVKNNTGNPAITLGSNNDWTISGDWNFSNGIVFDYTGNTVTMDGAGKTLTSNGTDNLTNLTLSGSITLSNNTHTISGSLLMPGTVTPGTSSVVMNASSGMLQIGGESLYDLTFNDGGGGATWQMNGTLDVDNDFMITSGEFIGEIQLLKVGGSWSNTGIFTHGNSVVYFDSNDTGETIETGGDSFYDLLLSHSSGGWTLQTDDITVENNFTIGNANTFVLENGRTLEVNGNFIQATPNANTTWTGSTLYLNGSGDLYDSQTRVYGGDTYSTLHIGANDSVAMYKMSASTLTVDAGGCFYSQDHNSTDGLLHIHGVCNSRANEYWSYATDFDGTDLSGGSERQAQVKFADGASLTVDDGDALDIIGDASNRTAITRQTAGNYGLTVNGTLDAQYFDVDYINSSGLNISSTAVITEITNGSFDNIGSGASASYITVSGINSTDSFANMVFDTNADGADVNVIYNVNADGANINWSFQSASGNKAGEGFDREVNGANITWSTIFASVNDGSDTDIDASSVTDRLSTNWTTDSEVGVNHYEYAFGTTAGGSDTVAFTSSGMTKNITKTGLSLSNGTTYYATIRAYNAINDLLDFIISDGLTIDTDSPIYSNISATATNTSITVTWISNEPTTSQINYGLTSAYGNQTTENTNLATNHSVIALGLDDDTTYHYQVTGSDEAGNTTNSGDNTITTPKLSATVITNVQVTRLSPTSVKVTWTTNHAADSKVRYGLSTDYGLEEYNPALVTSHEITLTSLLPDTAYHYEVISTGNSVAIDADATFQTTSPPYVPIPTIIEPTENEFVIDQTPTISGFARSGHVVRLYIDRQWVATVVADNHSSGTGYFSHTLAEDLTLGQHTLQVQAADDTGFRGRRSAPIEFKVGLPTIGPTLFSILPGSAV
ncbi:fibronectin type III domain-containing protein, partial [Patescibacteria group bacterium]